MRKPPKQKTQSQRPIARQCPTFTIMPLALAFIGPGARWVPHFQTQALLDESISRQCLSLVNRAFGSNPIQAAHAAVSRCALPALLVCPRI